MNGLPWGIHRVGDMFGRRDQMSMGLPDGREVTAVCEPYYTMGTERIRAAWWVLTGRAHAVIWPKPGHLETALYPAPPPPQQPSIKGGGK